MIISHNFDIVKEIDKDCTDMKSVIICEFNPLHTGHKRLLDFAATFSDEVICVMSGNFTQRGIPACCNKYKRALHALKAGAHLVVELPTIYATAPAENFALGAVSIANKLQADFLVFGSECGDIHKLNQCANLLQDGDVNAEIRRNLAAGKTYPKAVSDAVGTDILQKPNNVLAVEYLRALKKTNSCIKPITLRREDNYNGAPQQFASSSALRTDKNLRKEFSFDFVSSDINDEVEQIYCDFAVKFLSTLDKQDLQQIAGVSEGLHNRIFNADKTQGFEHFMTQIKTKRYTWLKLQRIVLNSILGVTTDKQQLSVKTTPLANALAVKKDKAYLLALTDKETDDVTKKADRLYAVLEGCKERHTLVKL